MLKFFFYICISTLVFCECSGFWFDLFEDDTDENATKSSSEDYLDDLVEWISKYILGLDTESEKPDSSPPVKNMTNHTAINPNSDQKNSSRMEENISASKPISDVNTKIENPPAVVQNASSSTETKKEDKIENPPAVVQNASSSTKTKKEEIDLNKI